MMRSPSRVTVRQAANAWMDGAHAGLIRNRSGDRYKPSALRGYEQALRLRVIPELGAVRLSELRRSDVQDFVDRMVAAQVDPSTIHNTLVPLKLILKRAVQREELALNPASGVLKPAVRGRRDRIAGPAEASELLATCDERDRGLWATAMYAGLRLGELRALTWQDIDLVENVIAVERSWDPRVGPVDPKSRAGKRKVPIPAVLRTELLEHRLRQGRAGEGLVFGRSATSPFNPSSVDARAKRAWVAAGLDPITPHECRHSFASFMIAAGVNAKALSTFMGHANIAITIDRYGHLMPGSEREAAALLDEFLSQPPQESATNARSRSGRDDEYRSAGA